MGKLEAGAQQVEEQVRQRGGIRSHQAHIVTDRWRTRVRLHKRQLHQRFQVGFFVCFFEVFCFKLFKFEI